MSAHLINPSTDHLSEPFPLQKNVFQVLHSSTDLSDQLVVLQLLSALHDSHDARLDLVLPVLVNLQRTAIEKSPISDCLTTYLKVHC